MEQFYADGRVLVHLVGNSVDVVNEFLGPFAGSLLFAFLGSCYGGATAEVVRQIFVVVALIVGEGRAGSVTGGF